MLSFNIGRVLLQVKPLYFGSRNKNNEKGVKKFFSNLFEEEQVHADEKQEKEIKEDQINYLKK